MINNSFKFQVCAGALLCLLFYSACQKESTQQVATAVGDIDPGARLATATAATSPCNNPIGNHIISLSYAYQLVDAYRQASRLPGQICQLYDQGGWVLAETFPASAIQAILAQPGVCSFRIYNGLDTDNRQHLVLVGVEQNGMDVLSRNHQGDRSAQRNGGDETNLSTTSSTHPDLILEMGLPCPRACTGVYTGS